MSLIVRILATGAILTTLPIVWQAGPRLRSTTLTTAWRWSLGVLFVAIAVWCLTTLSAIVAGPLADQLWYTLSVILLCPPIAVLGARRPGSRVWNWFVLVPLVLILGHPLAMSWNRDFESVALHVETPILLGHLLVLVMGVGNYLATRYLPAALLFGTALLAFVAPFFGRGDSVLVEHRETIRIVGVFLLSASTWTAWQVARRALLPAGFDRVWRDFRDTFGIVWARPIQERINDTARKENWPARLGTQGFDWNTTAANSLDRAAAESRIEHTLRWLLRRFVDPAWIDARLGKSTEESVG